MPLADDAGAADAEDAIERRLGKCLSPGPAGAQRLRRVECNLPGRELAVGLDHVRRRCLRHPACDLLVEGAREAIELVALERESGRHGVAAEAAEQVRMPR